jgi:hypothetical protein
MLQQLVGQDDGKIDWTPGAVPMGSQIGLLAAFAVVKNQPYTAEIIRQHTTVVDGAKRLSEAHNIQRREAWANLEQRELGERKMHGIVVQGCRTTGTTGGSRPITVVIETWQSPMLRIQLSTERDSDGNESRMEITRLRLGEPDLSKFLPPEHYKVVTER